MNIRPTIWLFLSSVLFSPFALSFTANGSVQGSKITWDNVFNDPDGMTISNWTSVAGLTPTSEWIPGSATISSTQLTFSGSDNNTFNVPITIKGMQYNTGGADPQKNTTPVFSAPTNCSSSEFSGSQVSALKDNDQCGTSYSLINSGTVAPFSFYRPVFDIDEDELISGLDGKAEGTYTASTSLSIIYYFTTSSGAFTYYQTQEILSFQIRYVPSYLTSIDVSDGNLDSTGGMGMMTPDYDTGNRTVTGTAIFNVKAKGYFSSGLTLTFDTVNNSNSFYLKGTKTGTEIPFSVKCPDCNDIDIVDSNGSLQVNNTIIEANDSPEEINFQIEASYINIQAENVETDSYSGSFNILFKEAL